MVLNNPILKVATSQAGLSAGQAVECQVTSAIVTAQPKFNTIPATGCAGETQSPGLTGWQLELSWLQDWSAGTPGGLSWFALQNDGKSVWFELTPNSTDATKKLTGNAYCTAGSYGGEFGTGAPATSDATWPLIAAPTVPAPTMEAMSAPVESPAEDEEQLVEQPA
jgi:hypothetical protein